MYKDEEERELMRAASRIDDACIDMAIHAIREGITEKELSSKVEHFFQEKGCDHLGFSIVAMGANGADPHHGTDGTVLKEGDSIVMDSGYVQAIPEITANSVEASLVHEAAIGKIAGEQLTKLMTLGLTEKEAEEEIVAGFLK